MIMADQIKLNELTFVIKGAGEMASGIAWRLHRSGFTRIIMVETAAPAAVRRLVSFCEAVYDGGKVVDGVEAVRAKGRQEINQALADNIIPVVVDPEWRTITEWNPDVVIDAIVAKKNLGTNQNEAELVIGLGPGFSAGSDVHVVIETNRGANCGRVLHAGSAEEDTGIPGQVRGYAEERVIRAPNTGVFEASVSFDDLIKPGTVLGRVADTPVTALIHGKVRGLIRDQRPVEQGDKIGDIEPRVEINSHLVSDKSLALAGGVLEAILWKYNAA